MDPHSRHLNNISICAGGGGLDVGFELAIPCARSILLAEREAFACATLVAAMQAGFLAEAPIWSDVRTLDGRPWRGLVDGLIGGIPCQPHSLAGRKRGKLDDRDLWSPTRRIIAQSRPWYVLIENVGGMLSAGHDEIAGAERVYRDLRKLGYAVEGGLFTAEEAGAPHQRERVFILGVADTDLCGFGGEGDAGQPSEFAVETGEELVDAGCGRVRGRARSGSLPGAQGEGEGEGDQWERHGDTAGGAGIGDMADDADRPRRDVATAGRSEAGNKSDRGCGRDVADGDGQPGRGQYELGGGEGTRARQQSNRGGAAVAGTQGPGWKGSAGRIETGELATIERSGEGLVDASSIRRPDVTERDGQAGQHGGAFDRAASRNSDRRGAARNLSARGTGAAQAWFRPLFPPGPHDRDGWGDIIARTPELEPAFRRVADGLAFRMDASRVDRLRMLGNGVVPLQAANAIRTLVYRLAARGTAGAIELVRMTGVA